MAHANIIWWKFMRYARFIFGLLYVLAGLAKTVPSIEDVPQTLRTAAINNAGTLLEPISRWLADHGGAMTAVVGVALFASGVSYLFDRLVMAAAIGQLAMIACFIAILARTTPEIVAIDLPFAIVAILLIRDKLQKRRAPATRPKVTRDDDIRQRTPASTPQNR
ncbi:DUF6041 domain-containing protein [Methylosinus sp. Sm6]|uniref:DUF6041 domain-containing protein n=1 Tax=Methylosinus sp. Sm6 TaxID=2866948 RepID=UPI001C99DBC9|nr:DUF6041 domain-containing protein [Methylosinus sp. Sm6]MBY6243043.1 DUF6041 domain-containing protein [Methylosinus sp. Sm6]